MAGFRRNQGNCGARPGAPAPAWRLGAKISLGKRLSTILLNPIEGLHALNGAGSTPRRRSAMRALTNANGFQSLRSITARSSSARVLDLHSLARDAALDPDHRARPMFSHPLLNRTLTVKHHPRPGEFEFGQSRGAIVTKVIFPFDPDDLELGGQFLLIDDPDLVEQLERHLDYRDADIARDVMVLKLLDRLPTLDPFLLSEALCANKLEVAPCYFRLSPTDKAEMLDFVSHQVETLIGLCLGGVAVSDAKAKRLSELILSEGDSPELAPLRLAMRMQGAQFAQAMFCWKAVLYYRWRSRALGPTMRLTRRSIASVEAARFDVDTAPYVRRAVTELETMIAECERRIAEMFRIYDEVFDALTEQQSPEPFRRFLVDGPRLFARLGERMGRLEQLTSFWQHQFPGRSVRLLSPEAVFDGLRNLLAALSLGVGLLPAEAEAKGVIWGPEDLEPRRGARRRGGPRPAAA
jgi:hypothetical protein